MEPEGSLPCEQDPATGPYPEPLKYSLQPHTLCLLNEHHARRRIGVEV
jgi:hypothetical protein